MDAKQTRVDAIWVKLKNNKAIAIAIVCATILISLASFLDAIKKIGDVFSPKSAQVQHEDKSGGLIGHPASPADHYHNARIYELNGDLKNAKASYSEYFQSNQDFIDPHYFFQDMLKNSDGLQETRRYYQSLKEKFPGNIMYEFLQARLLDPGERTAAYQLLLKRQPDYLPALYELSKELARANEGNSTLGERERELKVLEDFVSSEKGFLRYFIDKRVGQQALDEVQSRYELLKKWHGNTIAEAMLVRAEVYGDGMVSLTFVPYEPATAIWYKLPGMQDFSLTGQSPIAISLLSPGDHSGKQLANYGAKVGALAPGRYIVTLKYEDVKGQIRGPYDKEFVVPVKAMQDVETFLHNYWLNPEAKQFYYGARADDKDVNLRFKWVEMPKDVSRFREVRFCFDNSNTEQLWIKDGRRLIDADNEYPELTFHNLREKEEHSLLFRVEFINGKKFDIRYKFHIIKDGTQQHVEGTAVPTGKPPR